MIPDALREKLVEEVAGAEHPREKAIDVMYALSGHYGYMSDEAMREAADILGMTLLELEELATFYDFIFREPVGRYLIQVCDSLICCMDGNNWVMDHVKSRLGLRLGETTPDGLFTLLPTCCIGYCDRAPALMVNCQVYGRLTPDKIDDLLERLKAEAGAEAGPAHPAKE